MAGINGSGANFNKGINVGGLNQTGNTRKMQSTKQNEVQELKLNLNQADGYVKTRDVQEAKKKDDEPKKGGDGAKGKGNGKSWKENYLSRVAEKLKAKQDQPFNPNPNAGAGTFDWTEALGCAIGACGDTWGWW